MVICGGISDRMNERRCLLLAAGVVQLPAWSWPHYEGHLVALAGMPIAAMGFYGSKGPFFATPPMFLGGTAVAGGIAWINSIGNLGGFFGLLCVGAMKGATGSFSGGLYGLALLALIASMVCALFLHIPNPTRSAVTLGGQAT